MMPTTSDDDNQYRTNKTEPLPDAPMCFECGKTVEAWVVTFESTIHDDTGYSKLHRCPHCNALCFDDQRTTFGCLVFFPMFFISWWLMEHLTGEIEVGEDGVQGTDTLRVGIAFIAAAVVAWSCDAMIASIQKQLLRRKHLKQSAENG